MRERERTKPADLPGLPCPVFYINTVHECIRAIFPVPVCSSKVACYIKILTILHKASLPNFFVIECTEKEISLLLCGLCVVDLRGCNRKGVCVCETVSVTQARRALTWQVAFLTSTALTSLLFSVSLT